MIKLTTVQVTGKNEYGKAFVAGVVYENDCIRRLASGRDDMAPILRRYLVSGSHIDTLKPFCDKQGWTCEIVSETLGDA